MRPAATERARPIRPLVWFFALAYLLSWAWLVPLALDGQVVEQGLVGPPTFRP
jgi:hypothetical protein